jgi:hypothetical protein
MTEKTHAEIDRDHLLVLVALMARCLTERQVVEVMAAWKATHPTQEAKP